MSKRKQPVPAFETKAALEALEDERTAAELASFVVVPEIRTHC